MKTPDSDKYYPQKLRPLVKMIARAVKNNPHMLDDIDDEHQPLQMLMATLSVNIPGFADKSTCLNCSASMAQYVNKLDINVASLLVNMAGVVRGRLEKGVPFTEANKVNVSAAPEITHVQKCQATKARKLGLIAQSGKAHWAITTRGWAALKGERVPASVVTYRKKIIERTEDTTTLSEAFRAYSDRQQELRKKGKRTGDINLPEYDPRDYFEVAGYGEGTLV